MELQRAGWVLKCKRCGNIWVLEVSYKINKFKDIYHYCKYCKRNTFHEVLGRVDEVNIDESK